MEVSKDDVFRISNVKYDVDGTKVEPEQQVATRVIEGAAPATAKTGGARLGSMRTEILLQQSVAELAVGIRRMCKDCKHWDNQTFQKIIRGADHSPDLARREAVNQIRGHLLQTMNANVTDQHESNGEFDVEHALMSLGICRALTEAEKDLVSTHPTACCPEKTITPQSPSGFFQAKNTETTKATAIAYDSLMQSAQGKK